MARITIRRKPDASIEYFWSDTEQSEPRRKTVYKKTSDGIKRMTGVHFDSVDKRIVRH